MEPPRTVPGTRSVCQLCRRPIVWATTVASERGPGGKFQPFDLHEHPDGNVALYPTTGGRLRARALGKDDELDRMVEYRGMPHAATCTRPAPPPPGVLPPGVIDLAAARAARGRAGRR